MGNRAVITTEDKQIGIYVHWNGGRESVETFLAYCDTKNYRPPETDCYGWARMCQVIGNFFGGSTSIGIDRYNQLDRDNYDNGVYIINKWKIVGREFQHYKDEEIKSATDLEDNLNYLNDKQPKEEQLSKEEIHSYCLKWAISRGLTKDIEFDTKAVLEITKEILRDHHEHRIKEVDCIFENKNEITDSYAVATDYDEVVLVNPFTKEITPSAEWQFNADEDIFGKLEENKLAYVSMKTHHGIWSYIEDVTPNEIQNQKGMQQYLKYCKDNNISKEKIEEETHLGNLSDVMKYYKPLDKEVR